MEFLFFFRLCLVLASPATFTIPHNGCSESLNGKWIIYTIDEETFYPLDSDEEEGYLGKMIQFYANGKYEIFYEFSDSEKEIEDEGFYSVSANCKTILLDDEEYILALYPSKLVLLIEIESEDNVAKTEFYEYAVFRRQ